MILSAPTKKPTSHIKRPIDEREASVQKQMVQHLERAGFFVTQNREKYRGRGPKSESGIPDLIVLRRSIVAWIEVKTLRSGSKPSKEQLIWHARCREHGGLVYIARTLEDVSEIIAELTDIEQQHRRCSNGSPATNRQPNLR